MHTNLFLFETRYMTDKLSESTGFHTNTPVDGWLMSPANTKGKFSTEIQTSTASNPLEGTLTFIVGGHRLVQTSPQGCKSLLI
jgi:hypothetical protein